MGKAESEIQKSILEWLKVKGYFAWRNYLGGVTRQGFKTKNPASGMPDIMGLLKDGSGRMFAIEVKTSKGAVADHQAEKISQLIANGAIAFIARDLKTVEEVFCGLEGRVNLVV